MSREDDIERMHRAREPREKKPKSRIKPMSDKKRAQLAEEKQARGGDKTESRKEAWFRARRKEMLAVCQCGCGNKSQKKDNLNFRSSICHIFPQRLFQSIQFHELNWVERAYWGGCHANMDNKSMDLWPPMADWEDIQEKFRILAPLVTAEERAHKFFSHLEKLVNNDK